MKAFDDFNGWRALVGADFPLMGVSFRLAQVGERRTDYVTEISENTKLQSVAEGHVGPEALKLPEDAARALHAALSAYFGPAPDDYRARYEEARDALTVERARVDSILSVGRGGSSS